VKFFNKKSLAIAGLATAAFAASSAANAITLTYDSVVTSPAPQTSDPAWMTATITNSGLNSVMIVLETSVSSPEFITQIFFSLNGGTPRLVADDVNNPDLSQSRCNGAAPAGTGPWQLCLGFASSEEVRFDTLNGSPYTFYVTGVTESMFVQNGRGFYSVAHVQGISDSCSGWIGDNGSAANNPGVPVEGCGGTSVPEPGTLALLGLGLLGVGLTRRRLT